MIDAARKGAIKIDDAIIATPNKLDDLKRVIKNPLTNTKYTRKVEGQMANQVDWHHSFPKSVDGFAGVGKKTLIKGGDGITRTKIELPGTLKGQDGHFEWIIEANNKINHRKFIPKD